MHVRVINNSQVVQYSIDKLKSDYPQISFPSNLSNTLLNKYGVYAVQPTAKPVFDKTKQKVSEWTAVKEDSGYIQHWPIVDLSQQEIEEITNEEASKIRSERNQKLSECDWTQAGDSPVNKFEWKEYRQALRDITSQEEFPWVVQWPARPA